MPPCRISGRASNSPPTSIKWRAAAVTSKRGPPVKSFIATRKSKSSRVSVANLSRGCATRPADERPFLSRAVGGLHNAGINRDKRLLFCCWRRRFPPAPHRFHAANASGRWARIKKRLCSGIVRPRGVETRPAPSLLAARSLFHGTAFGIITSLRSPQIGTFEVLREPRLPLLMRCFLSKPLFQWLLCGSVITGFRALCWISDISASPFFLSLLFFWCVFGQRRDTSGAGPRCVSSGNRNIKTPFAPSQDTTLSAFKCLLDLLPGGRWKQTWAEATPASCRLLLVLIKLLGHCRFFPACCERAAHCTHRRPDGCTFFFSPPVSCCFFNARLASLICCVREALPPPARGVVTPSNWGRKVQFSGSRTNIALRNAELEHGNWKFSMCKARKCVCVSCRTICRRSSFIFLFFPIFSFYFLKAFGQNSLFIVTFYSAVKTNLNNSGKVKYVINSIHSPGCGRDRRPRLKVCLQQFKVISQNDERWCSLFLWHSSALKVEWLQI